ncbi:MAG: serine hydrolase domain-containing protein [Aestuariibacter sp.]
MMSRIYKAVILICCIPGIAFGNYIDSPIPPDKPIAALALPLINVINSGDHSQMTSFIRSHYAADYLDRIALEDHENLLMTTHEVLGPLTFHAFRDYQGFALPDDELHVVFKAEDSGFWFGAIISSDFLSPDKIFELRIIPARFPSNVAKPTALSRAEALQELKRYVAMLAEMDLFSGNVLLAEQETVLFQATYGQASKRFNVNNNLQTKFNLGSMNKMFTAIAIMQLVEAGKLSLHDKLTKFIDLSWLSRDVSDKIEIRHLLSHTSGLGSYFNRAFMDASKQRFRALSDYKPLIRNEVLRFEPGTEFGYSNTGMFLLGVVIEAVSGQNYFDYIQENIYNKAAMVNSGSYEMDQPVPNLAIGYHRDANKPTGWRNNLYEHVFKGGPAGGGFSTVEDLHRFALALTHFKLLNKALTQESYSAKAVLNSPYYGYGFGVRQTLNDIIVGHSGGFIGISSNMDIYLRQGYIAIVLSNYSGSATYVERKIRELLSRIE